MTEDGPLTPFNDSALTPLIPTAVMWLVAEAEEKLRNDSWLDLDLAVTLARLQSVAYCHFPNVQAWNCSRCLPTIPVPCITTEVSTLQAPGTFPGSFKLFGALSCK